MSKFIAVEELPRYAPGELKLDSSAVGRPDFRMRVFRYAPSDIWVPPTEDFLIVVYRQGATTMNRRVTGACCAAKRDVMRFAPVLIPPQLEQHSVEEDLTQPRSY